MDLTRSDSRNRSRQDDYKKRRNNSGDQKSDRPAKRAKRTPRDKSKSSKGNPSLPSYTDRTCQELELPPILVLALKDQKAVEMVENTGICIDVERLNRIPVGGRIRFAKENWENNHTRKKLRSQSSRQRLQDRLDRQTETSLELEKPAHRPRGTSSARQRSG